MEKQKKYSKLRIKLAKEKLQAAELLLKNGNFRDAVSRAYYCIFYAAKALLWHYGQDPHTHKGVSVLFHQFCAAHKKPATSFATMLSLVYKQRLDADYREEAVITKENAQDAIEMAKSFLKEIRSLIK